MLDQLDARDHIARDRRRRSADQSGLLRVLLDGSPGFRCVNARRSMEEALAEHWSQLPAVALIDIGLPGISRIEGLGWLREVLPHSRLRGAQGLDDDERIFNALCAGACGNLLKGTRLRGCLKVSRKWMRAGQRCHPKSHAESSARSAQSGARSIRL